jgi:hypothetical protein
MPNHNDDNTPTAEWPISKKLKLLIQHRIAEVDQEAAGAKEGLVDYKGNRIEARVGDRIWLAARAGCSPTAITKMLGRSKGSIYLPGVLNALGLPDWLMLPGARIYLDEETGELRYERRDATVEELIEFACRVFPDGVGTAVAAGYRIEIRPDRGTEKPIG